VIGSVAFGTDFETLEKPDKIYEDKTGSIKLRLLDLDSAINEATSFRAFVPIKWLWALPLKKLRDERTCYKVLNFIQITKLSAYLVTI
jgi:hypothetical protein